MVLSMRELLMFILGMSIWVIGGLVWAVRLEGRIRLIERLVEDEIASSKRTSEMILTKLASIETTLTRIWLTCAAFHPTVPQVNLE